jgi:hypothetical protein
MSDKKSQGIVRDENGQEQPADKEHAQPVAIVEEKNKKDDDFQKVREKSGF